MNTKNIKVLNIWIKKFGSELKLSSVIISLVTSGMMVSKECIVGFMYFLLGALNVFCEWKTPRKKKKCWG